MNIVPRLFDTLTNRTTRGPKKNLLDHLRRFAARNALFTHLRESGHGEQAEAAERAAKAAAAIGS